MSRRRDRFAGGRDAIVAYGDSRGRIVLTPTRPSRRLRRQSRKRALMLLGSGAMGALLWGGLIALTYEWARWALRG